MTVLVLTAGGFDLDLKDLFFLNKKKDENLDEKKAKKKNNYFPHINAIFAC